jgi:lysyl endopeptidase
VTRTTASQLFKLGNGAWPLEHWTASTDGDFQVIELATARVPAPGALEFRVFDVSHLVSTGPKVDFTCHVDVACITDPSIRQDGRAVARMRFTVGGGTFVCTGALLNDASSSLTPLFATANHCISTAAIASSLEAAFFFYPDTCGGLPAAPIRVFGATLLMADFDSDFALLRLAQSAPAGAYFLGWDNAPLPLGAAVFGIHHPAGEFQRYSAGTMQASIGIVEADSGLRHNAPFNRIRWTQGLTEGGSSGSPLMTGTGNFRGTLFGGPAGNSCTDAQASYSDFSNAYPLVASFLAGPGAADDHADSPAGATAITQSSKRVGLINRDGDADWFRVSFTSAGVWTVASFDAAEGNPRTDVVGEVFAADGTTRLAVNDDRSPTDRNFEIALTIPAPGTYLLRVTGAPGITGAYGLRSSFALPDDYGDTAATAAPLGSNANVGGALGSSTDEDWFRISFDRAGLFRVTSTGTTDMFARLYRSDGVTLISESDDIVLGVDTNFSIAANVNGVDTYYLRVTGFDGDIGAYGLVTSFTTGTEPPNYTDLWWNAAESGWGININHQANLVFATLFTFAADGRNLWLVASDLARQPDGSYTGPLYRTNGPVFSAQPWSAVTVTQVGTMTLTFSSPEAATLVYTFNGTSVTKQITRQRFGPAPTCVFTTGARTGATNVQDLWFNPSESGWGINLTQQGGLVFATLFTYAADNRDMWLVASDLRGSLDSGFTGPLYRISGPAFNAQPWTPVSVVPVGSMSLSFTTGNAATLIYTVDGVRVTKQIQRQVFGSQPTQCH